MKYKVLVSGLRYPTDPRIVRRLVAGEKVPFAERRMCEPHAIGDIIEDLASQLAKPLLAKSWVEEVGE